MGLLLHSCADVRELIELSFAVVSGVTPGIHVLDGVYVPQVEKGEFWGRLSPLAQWFQCRVDCVWRHLACQVFIMTKKICLKFASHHFLFYAVYICQKSLNFTYAFQCYQQNCSWLHFTWTTL